MPRARSQMSMNIRQRMYRVVPLFGLDKGGYVRIDVELARATLPRAPPPAWANIFIAFFNVHQWYEYDLPNFGNGVDPAYPCQTEDTHQCVQLCSLPSVKRFQIWGSPHKHAAQSAPQTFEFNVTQRSEYTVVLLTCASLAHDEFVNVSVPRCVSSPALLSLPFLPSSLPPSLPPSLPLPPLLPPFPSSTGTGDLRLACRGRVRRPSAPPRQRLHAPATAEHLCATRVAQLLSSGPLMSMPYRYGLAVEG